ncbi:DUF1090 domain-containing protein [Steroidobacter sp.]|uniref:DUF1090 domain-containing protein n=1 Tax=Steroidobacter sp. TaxID=1978227 RepID=UPI001A37A958|nr:DUF1090 domain-containing protein [Steroidobacter sp.]MBL8267238.1 DUF1090 domain-containing protein [Steroidobacter sp.]
MRTLVLFVTVLVFPVEVTVAAEPSPACDAKRASIEAQISEAQARGRTREVAGLKRALKNNEAHCTDATLAKEREAQMKKAQREVAERERDLSAAEAKGDVKKIESRKAKLEAARAELVEAEKALPR